MVARFVVQPRFYMKKNLADRWKEFVKIARREGSSASEKLSEFVVNYVDLHAHGNPQTLLTRFQADVGFTDPRFRCPFYHPEYQWCEALASPCASESCPREQFLRSGGP